MARNTTKAKPEVEQQQGMDLDGENISQKTPLAAAVSEAAGTDIVEYQPHEQAIKALEERFKDVVYDVSTPEGLAQAKTDRVAIRDVRYALQNTTKEVLGPYQAAVKAAQARVNQVKDFGASLAERVRVIEDPVDTLIKDEEDRQKREKEEKAEAERLRIDSIQRKVAHFRNVGSTLVTSASSDIEAMLTRLKDSIILPCDYAEFEAEATIARDQAIDQLEILLKSAIQREDGERRMREQQEQFDRQQRELQELRDKQKQEDDRRAEEQRQLLARQQADLDRQREDLQRQQDEQRKRDEQAQRDREELERLRAQVANPGAATATVTASIAAEPEPEPAPEAINPAPSVRTLDVESEQPAEESACPISAADIIGVVAMSFDLSENEATELLRNTTF